MGKRGKREKARASTKKDHQCNKELVIDIPDDSELEPVLGLDCCIYKVPKNLSELNKEVYTPQLISIGPLHHGNEQLVEMENQKSIYLSEFFKRTNCKVKWKDLVSILEKDEEHIRRCYAEKSRLSSNEYVKMIIFYAVLIIEHFIRVVLEDQKHKDDYMLKKPWLRNGVQKDLLLLENQLPFSVLCVLFELAFPADYPLEFMEGRLGFRGLTCLYFMNYYITQDNNIPYPAGVLHFTDWLRYFLSNKRPVTQKTSLTKNLCSATKLHEAGLEFKVIRDQCLTHIKFEKGELLRCKGGKLKMPQFSVNDSTECVVRNLMALEQCHYPSETYICNYIILMDFLINTAKDVDLLVEMGVIVNWLGSSEVVAGLANKFCVNIVVSEFCYHDICEELNAHHKNPYHRTMKTLRSVYFANIWRGTSTVAVVILLVITILQTINSFRQFRYIQFLCNVVIISVGLL